MKKVELYLNNAGFCYAKGSHAVKGDPSTPVKFGALFGLIRHPEEGWMLYDTGYSQRFFDATKRFPDRIYAMMTKVYVKPEEEIAQQVRKFGITPGDISHILLSHFHGDHICGLRDFPNAKIYCSRKAYDHTMGLGNFFAFTSGVLKKLLPDDISTRVIFVDEKKTHVDPILGNAYDLFGDGSILSYDLPGHAAGQIGFMLSTKKQKYFLIADAVWTWRAYKEDALPPKLVKLIFHSWKDYVDSITKVKAFHIAEPATLIVPTHCSATTDKLISDKPDMNGL